MSTIRDRLQSLLDILSEIPSPPDAPAPLLKGMDSYLKALQIEKTKYKEQERWKDFLAELANGTEASGRSKLNQLSDSDLKQLCAVHKIKAAPAKPAKTVKGKRTHKQVPAKKATKTKPAQAAIPAKYAPDTVIPAVTSREATTQVILDKALGLKQQGTI